MIIHIRMSIIQYNISHAKLSCYNNSLVIVLTFVVLSVFLRALIVQYKKGRWVKLHVGVTAKVLGALKLPTFL